jgi:hypothetical protein
MESLTLPVSGVQRDSTALAAAFIDGAANLGVFDIPVALTSSSALRTAAREEVQVETPNIGRKEFYSRNPDI